MPKETRGFLGKARLLPMNSMVTSCNAYPACYIIPTCFRTIRRACLTGPPQDWRSFLKRVEMEKVRWHDLRPTLASRLVMKGVNLLTVSKLLRYSSTVMTERYAHVAPNYLQYAVDLLQDINSLAPQLTPKLTPEGSACQNAVVEAHVSDSFQRCGPVAQKDRAAVS